jgi:hypothetical protein
MDSDVEVHHVQPDVQAVVQAIAEDPVGANRNENFVVREPRSFGLLSLTATMWWWS